MALNLAFSASLRIGELLGLTWDCVDISEDAIEEGRAYVLINKELQRVSKEVMNVLEQKDILLVFPAESRRCKSVRVLKTPKTQSSIRKVFLLRSVALMLADRKVKFSGHVFDCVDKGFGQNEEVDVVVRPEDVDIVPEEKGHLRGVVSGVTFLGVYYEIIVDIGGFKWMIQTTDFVDVDEHIGIYLEPDAIHVMHKSEYSGLYGDYSSFSNEFDELEDPTAEETESEADE